METGDLKNNLGKLLKLVRQMKLTTEDGSVPKFLSGDPKAYLPVLHQAFLHYSLPLSKWLAERGYELYGRNDLRFVESVYRVLRDVFSYKPPLTKEQFLSTGFAERKLIMSTRILELCRDKHNHITRSSVPKKKKQRWSKVSHNSRQYRKPLKVEPEIFSVHGSSSGFTVWEENQHDVRVETPFSSRQPSSIPEYQISHVTPPPSPRRSVPLPQYMGQISPCRQSAIGCIRSSLLADLDITPAVTPLKTSVRVEREQVLTSSTSSSSSLQTCTSDESQERMPPGDVIPQEQPNTAHHTTGVPTQTMQGRIESFEVEGNSGDKSVVVSNNSTGLERRIQELTDCIQQMSAKMVLLETQLLINKERGTSEPPPNEDQFHHQSPLKENIRPTEENASGCAMQGLSTQVQSSVEEGVRWEAPVKEVRQEPPVEMRPATHAHRSSDGSDSSDDLLALLSASKDRTHLQSVSRNGKMDSSLQVSSEALIAQLRSRSQDTRQLFYNALTRSSVYT
jgi:centrosomal protein CEP44